MKIGKTKLYLILKKTGVPRLDKLVDQKNITFYKFAYMILY